MNRVTGLGIEVHALAPQYLIRKLYMSPEELYLKPTLFDEEMKSMGDWLKKAIEAVAGEGQAVHFRDEEWEKDYPAMFDFLASRIGPGGKPREGACLLVYARDGEVTACIKDRGLKRTFYGRSDGIREALRELEATIKANA